MGDEKDLADLTVEEQVALLQAQPDEGQTDNSPPSDIPQPPQEVDWEPPVSL